MTVKAEHLVNLMLTQQGKRYVFGREVKPSDTNPAAFDCSEIVEWATARCGVTPRVPDGSWFQARHCLPIPVADALKTRGALLFRFSSNPFKGARPSSAHVAVSLGNGETIEARGSKFGVGKFNALNRGWTHAGLLPGVEYDVLEVNEELAVLSVDEQKELQLFLKELAAIKSDVTFVRYLIPWFRLWRAIKPEGLLKRGDNVKLG